jgi:hypothetical protein
VRVLTPILGYGRAWRPVGRFANLTLINNASPAVGGRIRRRISTLILRQSTQHLINAAARNGVAGAAREDAVQSDVGTAGQTFRRALRRERARCPRWCAVIIGRVDAATQNALSARFIRDGADLNKRGGEKQCRNQCTPTCAPGGGAMQRFRPRAAYSHLVPPRDRRRQCRHQLVSRFRSSLYLAAPSVANFGIKGTLANI